MIVKIVLVVFVLLAGFLGFVSTRPSKFRYERSGLIQAPADKIYPYIRHFKNGALWNPFAQKDPNMKSTFSGVDGQVGAIMTFDGNREAGAGQLEILQLDPPHSVDIKLTMTSPFHAENLIQYRLTPEGSGTRFNWAMSGDGGFFGKLISVFINCEKLVAPDLEKGIAQLKTIVESQK
jgi:hypothetical protein